MTALFRSQALRALHWQGLGSVSMADPPPLRWSLALALAVGLAAVLLLGLAQHAPRMVVSGSLVPDSDGWRAEILVPAGALGALQLGQPVRLRLEADPLARFGGLTGRVSRIGSLPLTAGDAAVSPYRVVVDLDPLPPAWSGRPLTAGLRLQADLRLERRRLWEWVLEPLLGLQQRL